MERSAVTGRILIVEDEKELGEITKDYLVAQGHSVVHVLTAEEAYRCLSDRAFDLMVLDISLPDEDGFQICRQIRDLSDLPIVFASARTGEGDKIEALDIGGDDYLAKPYSLKELNSRINALLRRSLKQKDAEAEFLFGDLRLVPSSRKAWLGEKTLDLSPKEFDLLAYFMRRPDTTITKEELLSAVWGTYAEAELSTVSVHIRWLREKIEKDPSKPRYICTVWGRGYRFESCEEN